MAKCKAEFLVEPFTEGSQGIHVVAAIDAVTAAGLEPEVGPFGTSVEGDPGVVLPALQQMIDAAIAEGASHISISTSVTP